MKNWNEKFEATNIIKYIIYIYFNVIIKWKYRPRKYLIITKNVISKILKLKINNILKDWRMLYRHRREKTTNLF